MRKRFAQSLPGLLTKMDAQGKDWKETVIVIITGGLRGVFPFYFCILSKF